MMMTSTKMSSPPITPEVIPMTSQASRAGMKVLRHSNCPMSKKREADPMNEVTRTNTTVLIIPMIRKPLKAFLKSSLRFMEVCSKNGFYLIEQCIDNFPYERQLHLTSSSKQLTDHLEPFILRYETMALRRQDVVN